MPPTSLAGIAQLGVKALKTVGTVLSGGGHPRERRSMPLMVSYTSSKTLFAVSDTTRKEYAVALLNSSVYLHVVASTFKSHSHSLRKISVVNQFKHGLTGLKQ